MSDYLDHLTTNGQFLSAKDAMDAKRIIDERTIQQASQTGVGGGSTPFAHPSIPHTDLWPNGGLGSGGAGVWDPTAAPTKGQILQAPLPGNSTSKLRADLKLKVDSLYGERRSAFLLVEDLDARIHRLNQLIDDLR